MFKTLRGRITATYFLVVLISLLLASLFFLFFLGRYIRSSDREDLGRQVDAVARDIRQVNRQLEPAVSGQQSVPSQQPAPAQSAPSELQGNEVQATKLIKSILNTEAEVLEAKLLLVAPSGLVVEESSGRPVFGNRTIQLPEGIFSEKGPRVVERYFPGLRKDYLFATAPTTLAKGQLGFLAAVKTIEPVRTVAGTLVAYVALAGLIALALTMALAFYLSSAISRPVREVTEAARRMAGGEYGQEVEVRGSDETAELARDFNVMSERVRTAYELQRDFVGNVSHELRTPLTSIEGFSQALLDGVSKSPEEQRRSLEIINQESKRLNRLLGDLLLLSQIDAGELATEKESVDLTDVLRKLESVYSGRAGSMGVCLRVDAPERPLSLYTDRDRLERILTNLLDNALKYTGEGGTVALSAAEQDGFAMISVADTGPGIPPEQLPLIFERFHRVDKSRAKKHGGSGLGLSICKELVETLGGTIRVQSLVGHGTTFTVTLPTA
jgi:signal transduction histidine kinase